MNIIGIIFIFNYIDFVDIIDFDEGMNFIIKLFIIFIVILTVFIYQFVVII